MINNNTLQESVCSAIIPFYKLKETRISCCKMACSYNYLILTLGWHSVSHTVCKQYVHLWNSSRLWDSGMYCSFGISSTLGFKGLALCGQCSSSQSPKYFHVRAQTLRSLFSVPTFTQVHEQELLQELGLFHYNQQHRSLLLCCLLLLIMFKIVTFASVWIQFILLLWVVTAFPSVLFSLDSIGCKQDQVIVAGQAGICE